RPHKATGLLLFCDLRRLLSPYVGVRCANGNCQASSPRSRTLFGNARPGNSVSRLSVCTAGDAKRSFSGLGFPKGLWEPGAIRRKLLPFGAFPVSAAAM